MPPRIPAVTYMNQNEGQPNRPGRTRATVMRTSMADRGSTSPMADDFFAAALATAEITAECGNYEMWQLANDAVSKRG